MGGSKKLLGLIVIGAATFGMSSVAMAGKGTSGGKGKPSIGVAVATSSQLSAPASAAVGENFVVTGSGFAPGVISLTITTSTSVGMYLTDANDNGAVFFNWAEWSAGPVSVVATQSGATTAAVTIQIN